MFNFFFKIFLIILEVPDERSKALIALQVSDFFVQDLNLGSYKLTYFLALFSIVDPFFGILGSDFLYNFILVFFETLLDHLVKLFFAIRKLFADILGKSLNITTELHLSYHHHYVFSIKFFQSHNP